MSGEEHIPDDAEKQLLQLDRPPATPIPAADSATTPVVDAVTSSVRHSISPDQQALSIAERHAASIPNFDRVIPDIAAGVCLVDLFADAKTGTSRALGALSTSDKFGNIPANIMEAAFFNDDRDATVTELRAFAADPLHYAAETNKVSTIANSTLPASVKNALCLIILAECPGNTVDLFRELADDIDAHPDIGLQALFQKKQQYAVEHPEHDQMRQMAVLQFISTLYPSLANAPEVALLEKIRNLTPAQKNDLKIAADVAKSFGEITHLNTFRGYEDETELHIAFLEGTSRMKSANGLIDLVFSDLVRFFAEKIVSA